MAVPYRTKSVDAVTSTTKGSPVETKGHTAAALGVEGNSGDTWTVKLEVKINDKWAVVRDESGSEVSLSDADANSDNRAYIPAHPVVGTVLRAHVTDYSGGTPTDAVTAYVYGAGREGPADTVRQTGKG